MSPRGSSLAPEDARSKVSLKLDLLNAANIDSGMTAGQFRFFARVLQQLDLRSWTATIGDDRLGAELPECKSRHTANDHRAAIRTLGYWDFDPGSGRHPTRYFFVEAIPQRVRDELEAKKLAIQTMRANRTAANRDVVASPRKRQSRGGRQTPDTVVATPPVHIDSSHYQHAQRRQGETPSAHMHARILCPCGQPAIQERRIRPSGASPAGTNWIPDCQNCADDWIPMPDEECRSIRSEHVRTDDPGSAYRAARDGL